jgi:hypothetical protein
MKRTQIAKIRDKYVTDDVKQLCDYALALQELIHEAHGHLNRWNQYTSIAQRMTAIVRRDVDGSD